MLCLFAFVFVYVHLPRRNRDRRGRDRMVVGFTITYAISAYHHQCRELETRSRRGVLGTTLCNKVVSDLRQVAGFLRVLRFPLPIN